MKKFVIILGVLAQMSVGAKDGRWIQQQIDACAPGGVVEIGQGIYEIFEPLVVTNLVSLQLHKSAILRAVKPMDFVLTVNNGAQWTKARDGASHANTNLNEDYNFFVTGGQIDANGLASCMRLDNYHHYLLRDMTFLNGNKYGLAIDTNGHGYELIADNLYFKCTISGLKGNTAVYSQGGDSHYIDCIVVDWTCGFHLTRGGSNRLTRCHVWGGPLPPRPCCVIPEMLEDSVNFRIADGSAILRDCYADTGKIGYHMINGGRLLGCSYYNNTRFHLTNDIVMIKHDFDKLIVSGGSFSAWKLNNPKVYEGTPKASVIFRDNLYNGFAPSAALPQDK